MTITCMLPVYLLSSEQFIKFERFPLQRVQMVNKSSSLKAKMIGNIMLRRTELMAITFDVYLSHVLDNRLPLQITAWPIMGR